MKFYDMDGAEIKIGDYVKPVEGREVKIISCGQIPDYTEDVLIGQQTENLFAFSILTAENLAAQFKKSGSSSGGDAEEILNIIMGGDEA